ncbi:unnamed protein product, partial [marine sediment metagenome]
SPVPTCPVTLAVNLTTAALERRFIANEIQPLLERKDRHGHED